MLHYDIYLQIRATLFSDFCSFSLMSFFYPRIPVLGAPGFCRCNVGGVLGEEKSFPCLPRLSVALIKCVMTMFSHHQFPLWRTCLSHLPNACFSFKACFKSQILQEVPLLFLPFLPSPATPPSCFSFPNLLLLIRSD